jgi:hypothetical protein
MAQLAYILSGAAPVVKKFQFGVTLTALSAGGGGIPFTIPAAGTPGVVIGTTTGATDLVGLSLDAGTDSRTGLTNNTYVTAQQTDGTSAQRVVSLIINPDACWSWKMCQGATENTALTLRTVTTASAGGTAITTGESWSSTAYADGYTWCYVGANAGAARKITSTSATAGTVTVPFDYATVVGDTFIRVPWAPMMGTTIQLTTLLTQADASIAVGTGAPFRPIELILRDGTDNGVLNSFVLGVSNSHALRLA